MIEIYDMPTQLQLDIQETIQEIVHLERVEQQAKVTKRELDEAYTAHLKLEKKLEKELKDIERMEGLSTKAIFHKILGNKEKQLEKERQEYLELSLKEEDIKKSIDLLEYESSILSAKLGTQKNLDGKLEKLKLRREEEIIKEDPVLRNQLLNISQKIEDSYRFKSEVEEALEVGSVCHQLTGQIVGYLSKVRNWGQWQSGANRRHLSMMKRDAIDRARNLSYQVKHHLNLFDQELRDIGKRVDFDSDTSKFSAFSDFFFSNIITDWIVNNQLATAINSAVILRNNLASVINELKNELVKVERDVINLNQKRDKILVS